MAAERPRPAPDVEPAADQPRKPIRKPFVRRGAVVRMPADAAERQGRVTTLAWTALGGRDAALAFLNTHDPGLGARPIDLAVADAAGLAAVEAAIAARRMDAADPAVDQPRAPLPAAASLLTRGVTEHGQGTEEGQQGSPQAQEAAAPQGERVQAVDQGHAGDDVSDDR